MPQWPDRHAGSGTAPSQYTATMVQPRSSTAISRPEPCPTSAPPSRHPVRRQSQIPIDKRRARQRRATPARGFLHRGFSDACRPSARPRSSAAGIQEALTDPEETNSPLQLLALTLNTVRPVPRRPCCRLPRTCPGRPRAPDHHYRRGQKRRSRPRPRPPLRICPRTTRSLRSHYRAARSSLSRNFPLSLGWPNGWRGPKPHSGGRRQ